MVWFGWSGGNSGSSSSSSSSCRDADTISSTERIFGNDGVLGAYGMDLSVMNDSNHSVNSSSSSISSLSSNSSSGLDTPPSKHIGKLSSLNLDVSSRSDNSYEADDDTSTSMKVRVKIYGSSLFEMALGDLEDGRAKKGILNDYSSDANGSVGQKVIGSINRKSAWLIFFVFMVIGAVICLYEREKRVVDDTIHLMEYGEVVERHSHR